MMKVNAVIFDLDGTLTEPLLDFDRIRSEIGVPTNSLDILKAIEAMPPDRQQQAHAVLQRHERHAAENARLNDGVLETLSELRRRQLPIGLLTRNTRENTLAVARQLGICFDEVIARHDGPAKPHAYGVLELCRRFGVEPAQTLVVGDFLHDMLAANSAGAVAVLMKTHPNADHYSEHADYVISHMSQLLDLIDEMEQN